MLEAFWASGILRAFVFTFFLLITLNSLNSEAGFGCESCAACHQVYEQHMYKLEKQAK